MIHFQRSLECSWGGTEVEGEVGIIIIAGAEQGMVVDLLYKRAGKWGHLGLSGGLRAAHRTSVGPMILQKCHHVTT